MQAGELGLGDQDVLVPDAEGVPGPGDAVEVVVAAEGVGAVESAVELPELEAAGGVGDGEEGLRWGFIVGDLRLGWREVVPGSGVGGEFVDYEGGDGVCGKEDEDHEGYAEAWAPESAL